LHVTSTGTKILNQSEIDTGGRETGIVAVSLCAFKTHMNNKLQTYINIQNTHKSI